MHFYCACECVRVRKFRYNKRQAIADNKSIKSKLIIQTIFQKEFSVLFKVYVTQ